MLNVIIYRIAQTILLYPMIYVLCNQVEFPHLFLAGINLLTCLVSSRFEIAETA